MNNMAEAPLTSGIFILKEGAQTLSIRILNTVFAAALGMLTARLLGPHGRGIYALPVLNAGLVIAFFSGLSTATSYMMLNKKYGSGVLKAGFQASLIYSILGAGAVTAIAYATHQAWTALPAAFALPPACAIAVATGYWFGVRRVRSANRLALFLTIATLVFMVIGLVLVARTPSMAIVAWIAANTVVGAVASFFVFLNSRRLSSDHVPLAEFLSFATKVGSMGIVRLLNLRADVYVVAALASPAALGIYGVAVAGAESLLIVTQVASVVTMPHIGSLTTERAARLAARCARNNLVLAIAICLVVAALAPLFVGLLFGKAFLPAVWPLRVLLIGILATSVGSVISVFFTIRLGIPRLAVVPGIAAATVSVAASILLVPKLGIIGAAMGSTFGYIVGFIVTIWNFSRITHIPKRTVILPQSEDFESYRTLWNKGLRTMRETYVALLRQIRAH